MSLKAALFRTDAERVLAELGMSIPTPASPIASYMPTRRIGNQIIVSGQIPVRDGTLIAKGIVPRPGEPR